MDISSFYKDTNLEFYTNFSFSQGDKLHSTFSTEYDY